MEPKFAFSEKKLKNSGK